MTDHLSLWLQDAEKTHSAGKSLAQSLYTYPVDIWLTGPLGAGKTTFIQGFAEGLGVQTAITSPTYALEQRYATRSGHPLLHMDLYRLEGNRAMEMAVHSHDHVGIRCIEWSERLGDVRPINPVIRVSLTEEDDGRMLTVVFEDMALPSQEEIERWRAAVVLPPHITAHCRAVAELAAELAEHLIAEGTIVRRTALERAAQVHDLLRFVDFHPSAKPEGITYPEGADALWAPLRQRYAGMRHEDACAAWLQEHGYPQLATIVVVHGLELPAPSRTTIEQKILYYADKRTAVDNIVSIDERFDDFVLRYGKGIESEKARFWREEAKAIEHELFPDGPPR